MYNMPTCYYVEDLVAVYKVFTCLHVLVFYHLTPWALYFKMPQQVRRETYLVCKISIWKLYSTLKYSIVEVNGFQNCFLTNYSSKYLSSFSTEKNSNLNFWVNHPFNVSIVHYLAVCNARTPPVWTALTFHSVKCIYFQSFTRSTKKRKTKIQLANEYSKLKLHQSRTLRTLKEHKRHVGDEWLCILPCSVWRFIYYSSL